MKSFKFKTTFVLTLLAITPQITQAHIMGTNLANPLGRWKDKSNEATPIFYNCTPEDVSTKRKNQISHHAIEQLFMKLLKVDIRMH